MTTAVLFVLFLLVVAGLVAAAGDRMGHLAARRKIRFGTMRPRNVSTIIAVVTGLVISLVTFLILFALWENFRDALLRHGQVRAELAAAENQLQQAGDDLRVAQEQTQQAVDEKAAVEQELTDLQVEASDLRGQVTAAAMKLDQKNQLIARRESEVSELTARRNELQEEVATLEDIAFGIMPEYARLKSEIVYPGGTYLSYLSVAPTEVDALENDLERVLVKLEAVLKEQGLSLHEEARARTKSFAASYPYRYNEYGAVVIFSTTRDVPSGGVAEIELAARSLEPLSKVGDELLTVLVEDDQATIAWRDQEPADFEQFEIPAKFDDESIKEFTRQLKLASYRGGRNTGFLPDLESGEIVNPLEDLIDELSLETLAQQPRPFTIQFVAKSDANALQGLPDCSTYISKYPPGPPQE